MLKPVRYDLYEKALNRQPKPKKDYIMITVDEALLFAEWLAVRYERAHAGLWYAYRGDTDTPYTTRQLWELYQQFLGKKPKTISKDMGQEPQP